jgi:hypothetical protein
LEGDIAIMGAKTKAASDAVRAIYRAQVQAVFELETILGKMPALEAASRELAQKADAVYRPLEAKLGPLGANQDPTFRELQDRQFAVWRQILDLWSKVGEWIAAHARVYSGMDAALRTLKDRITRKETADFFKKQKSLPDAKYVYEAGFQANQIFQDALNQAIGDVKEIPIALSILSSATKAAKA